MRLSRFIIGAVVVAGVAATLIIHRENRQALQEKDAAIRRMDETMAEEGRNRERLTKQLSAQQALAAVDLTNEMARLRNEIKIMQQKTNDLARQKQERKKERKAPQPAVELSEQQKEQLEQEHSVRVKAAMMLAQAISAYAEEHNHLISTNLEELKPYFSKIDLDGLHWTGTNQIEIVYSGSLDQLEGMPYGSVAITRSAPWVGPDGVERRVYGFLDGHGQLVTGDAIKEWDETHVFNSAQATTKK